MEGAKTRRPGHRPVAWWFFDSGRPDLLEDLYEDDWRLEDEWEAKRITFLRENGLLRPDEVAGLDEQERRARALEAEVAAYRARQKGEAGI
jgi:hypothetical protein